MRFSTVFTLVAFAGCADAQVPEVEAAPLGAEQPGTLPDESITIVCSDGVCKQVETVHEVVDPGQDDSPGPHYRNVELQTERKSEFSDLTREIIGFAGERCDLARTDEEEEIQVAVHLKEQPFDFTRYRGGVGEDIDARRATLNAERRAHLRPSQSATESRVVDHGGIVVYRRFLSNIVDVRLSSCLVADLATWPDVVGLSIPRDLQPSGVDGVARRQGVNLPPYGISGLDGSNGSLRSGGARIRYGVIEAPGTGGTNNLNTSHLSFKDGTGSALRIVDTDRCDFFFPSNQCINTANGTVATHGTTVTSILLSDLADGQDPGVSNTTDRHKRSGIVPEATVHYYRTSDETSLATAIDEAVANDGIDIINMSLSPGSGGFCDNGTQNGVREAIEAATDAGVLSVVAGGNSGLLPPCNINNYDTFPDTLAVGGTDDADSLFDLESVERNSQASFGSISVTLRGWRSCADQNYRCSN